MRVQLRKDKGVAFTHYEVIAEYKPFYVAMDTVDGTQHCLSKKEYEPVPAERWVDVTAECDVYASGDWLSIKHGNADLSIHGDSYRFRKIRVLPTQWAFIVEKKEAV